MAQSHSLEKPPYQWQWQWYWHCHAVWGQMTPMDELFLEKYWDPRVEMYFKTIVSAVEF